MLFRQIFASLLGFTLLTTPAIANTELPDNKKLKGYHTSSIVERWGQPNIVRSNRYGWQECVLTGYVISHCQYGSCRSHQEKTCCYQQLNTDKDGVITKYSVKG